jgi:hypothetical protein
LRWRVERDYQELKQELGLGDYEGRGWRGFHHHATLCIAAYGFLIAERGALPPSGPSFSARSRDLPFPTVTDAEAPPIQPERHIPNSIATMRRRLIVALARTLPRCPCCNAPIRKTIRIPITDAVRLRGCGKSRVLVKKGPRNPSTVIPAKAGIHFLQWLTGFRLCASLRPE